MMKFIKEKLSAKKIFYGFSNVFLIGCTIAWALYVSAMIFLEPYIIRYDFGNFIIPVAIAAVSIILVYGILRGIYDLFGHLEAIQHSLETLAAAKETNETTSEPHN